MKEDWIYSWKVFVFAVLEAWIVMLGTSTFKEALNEYHVILDSKMTWKEGMIYFFTTED